MSAAAMFRTEARIQARERVWASSAAVSLAMAAVLVAVNRDASRAVAPYALLFEVGTVGAVFAASLTLLDRTVGVFAALSTTPRGVRSYVRPGSASSPPCRSRWPRSSARPAPTAGSRSSRCLSPSA
jgi:hypothetical protein